ncbi:Hypothetical protein R9X50_00067100 [Acrodontium crateriforme]|uniref:Uncharacterized protein n=1 Tax=Acrodontium crateriforme TaxID=150365 RepID=A0AAQ3LZ78_9PEZI|nr:Hypothetical protein R9X50_00067100 [Acrodontium crateriforme]
MEQPTDDKLAHLARQIKNWRPLHPFYRYMPLVFVVLSLICPLILYYNGWRSQEAGLFSKTLIWGGYTIGPVLAVPVFIWERKNNQELENFMQEFDTEKVKRGL